MFFRISFCAALAFFQANAQYTIRNYAGGGFPDGAQATNVAIGTNPGIAVDTQGNIYLTSSSHAAVYKVPPDGSITTIETSPLKYIYVQQFVFPYGIAVDMNGNVYVTDPVLGFMIKIAPSGLITVIEQVPSGSLPSVLHLGFSLNGPQAVATDTQGNFYIADTMSNAVFKVDPSGSTHVTTIVQGNPAGVAEDLSGNIYVSETQINKIIKVNTAGKSTVIAGTGIPGYSGDNGPAVQAQLNLPSGLALDSSGALYVADYGNNAVRKIDTTGTITTVASHQPSCTFASAPDLCLVGPTSVAIDLVGNVYVADGGDGPYKIDKADGVTIVAGNGTESYSGDNGPATDAQLDLPFGLLTDPSGGLYISDTNNNRIRRVNSKRFIATVPGTYSQDPVTGVTPLRAPSGLVIDPHGNLLIADYLANQIFQLDSAGKLTVIAGTGTAGDSGDHGPAINAMLNSPHKILETPTGELLISDWGSSSIRKIDSSGNITTIAGTGSKGYSGDGGPAIQAQFSQQFGIAQDAAGNIYVADTGNSRIRRIDRNGIVTTIAGNGVSGYSGDGGPAISASLRNPEDVLISDGKLFIADTFNYCIRVVDASGTIRTIAGTGSQGRTGDGGAAWKAQLVNPRSLAADNLGNIYFADADNIRVLVPETVQHNPRSR